MKIIITILLFYSLSLAAQRPSWIKETPPGYTHDYFVGVGRSSLSESDARNSALADALQRIVESGTITLEGSQEISSQSVETFKNGQTVGFDAIDKVVKDIRIVGESKTVKGLREEEYYAEENSGTITVWSLVKIPKKDPLPYEPTTALSPLWRSAVLPGWGQFYKGSTSTGYAIALSEAALVPAGIILNSLKVYNQTDARHARTQALRDYYTAQSNSYSSASLACFVTAGAIYIYNIVDAIVTQGEKEYVAIPNIQLNSSLIAGVTTTSVSVHITF